MRFSRTDLVPVLTIMAGGAFGFSLSAGILLPSLLLLSGSGNVVENDPFLVPSPTAEAVPEQPDGRFVEEFRRYELDRMARLNVDVAKALATAADLSREQFDIELTMNRTRHWSAGGLSEGGRRLLERKNVMDDEIDDLWREVQRLTSEARTIRPKASNWLDDAATTIDDGKLWERVRYSRGIIGIEDREYVREFEAETTRIVEELQRELQSASRALQSLPVWSPTDR